MTDSCCDSEEARDALRDAVSREVMGWIVERIEWAYSDTTLVWHDTAGHPVLTRYSWQPDRHDAQAMEVVDRMIELGFRFTMGVCEDLPTCPSIAIRSLLASSTATGASRSCARRSERCRGGGMRG